MRDEFFLYRAAPFVANSKHVPANVRREAVDVKSTKYAGVIERVINLHC